MSNLKKMINVLLIDDSSDDNFFHERAIKKSGVNATITVFTYAEEALTFLQGLATKKDDGSAPDLIFLDINMPRMTGWEFLQAYADLPDHVRSSIVILMLSTSPDPKDQELAKENQFVTDFNNKPLTADGFREIVEYHFGSNANE